MLLSTVSLMAQITGMSESNSLFKNELENNKGLESDLLKSDEIPVSNVVNPDNYYIGPGDVLMVKAIPMFPTPMPVTVTPDNKILLPKSGGVIDVNGKTLTEVNELIRKSFTTYKSDAIVSVVFFKSHLSFVEVEGNVLNSSVYSLPSTFKISDAIQLANKRSPITQRNNANEDIFIQERKRVQKTFSRGNDNGEYVEYWKRNILVIHEDGSSSKVDLTKSMSENNSSFNPYVRQGDKIIVPFDKKEYNTISISGEVNRPITMPYKSGDKLSELASHGLGLTDDADENKINFFQGSNKTKLNSENRNIIVSVDTELHPGARIIVGSNYELNSVTQGVVTVKGFVREPGAFPIVNSKTTLSEIINQAGGLTDDAYLPLAKVYRQTNEFNELSSSRTEAFRMFSKSNLSLEDTVRYTLDVSSIEPIVAVDFTKALNNSKFDIPLENGDEIIIPSAPNRVYVFGRVANPGFVEFDKGQSIDYYIQKTGGFTEVADEDRTAVIRKNTSAWAGELETEVYDGDYIYVPGEVDLSSSTEQSQKSTYLAAISAILTLGFLIVQVLDFNRR